MSRDGGLPGLAGVCELAGVHAVLCRPATPPPLLSCPAVLACLALSPAYPLSVWRRSQIPVSSESRQGDVYRVEQEDLSGPWEVTNVLQPTVYENDKGASNKT